MSYWCIEWLHAWNDFCKHCTNRKQKCVQFYSSSRKSYRLLDLIHYDVFGHVKVLSIFKDFHLSLIDDYSIRTWVYFLISKIDVLTWLEEFKASWKIILVWRLKCWGLIMVVSFFLQSLVNFVGKMASKSIRELHIPLNMERARSMFNWDGLDNKF